MSGEAQRPAAPDGYNAPVGLVIEVAAGVIFQSGLLLITQRRPGDHLGGLWEFPGGKREPGESFEDCLLREIHEELGIAIRVESLFAEVLHHYPEKSVLLRFYHCSAVGQSPACLGCHNFAWVSRPQLDDYEFPAADVGILEQLRSSHLFAS